GDGSRAEITDGFDTPASEAGIKPGDILLQVGKTKGRDPADVLDASFFIPAGATVPITVIRGKEKLTFNVQTETHPLSRQLPLYSDGTRMPTPPTLGRRAIPLNLQQAPPKP